jgi:hypothetical protein
MVTRQLREGETQAVRIELGKAGKTREELLL